MLASHESQTSWLRKQHGIEDPVGSMLAWSLRRGKDLGVTHAEGFRQYKSPPYPRTPALQRLVGEALIEPDSPATP